MMFKFNECVESLQWPFEAWRALLTNNSLRAEFLRDYFFATLSRDWSGLKKVISDEFNYLIRTNGDFMNFHCEIHELCYFYARYAPEFAKLWDEYYRYEEEYYELLAECSWTHQRTPQQISRLEQLDKLMLAIHRQIKIL